MDECKTVEYRNTMIVHKGNTSGDRVHFTRGGHHCLIALAVDQPSTLVSETAVVVLLVVVVWTGIVGIDLVLILVIS